MMWMSEYPPPPTYTTHENNPNKIKQYILNLTFN